MPPLPPHPQPPPPPPPTPPPSPTLPHRVHGPLSRSPSPLLSVSPSPAATYVALPTIKIPPPAAAAARKAPTSAPATPAALKVASKYSFKTRKSSSLDNDILTAASRKPTEWKDQQLPALQRALPRAASTSSLASSFTGSNYQEYKMEIINQGKCLCGQYIRSRLRRAGFLNRKAIQRLRNILEPSSSVVYDVFPALNSMGEELERMHPRIYSNVSRQLSRAPFGELEDSDSAPMLLNLVAKDLFRSSITWGKIISIFAVCGGFAIDCVRQGHYDYLQCLVDGIAEIIEDDLVHWLADNGGWAGLQQHIRPPVGQITLLGWLTLFVTVSSGVFVISNCVKNIGCHLYSMFF